MHEIFLELSPKKIKEIVIDLTKPSQNLQKAEVSIENIVVWQVKSYKYMGIVIDDRLTWHYYIDYLFRVQTLECIVFPN